MTNFSRLAAAMRAVSAFAELGDEQIAFLVNSGQHLDFAADEVILRQGEPSEDAILIAEGDVAVTSDSSHGEVVIARLQGPCLVGEVGAFARLTRTATVRARSPVSALRLGREALMEVSRSAPSMLFDVIARLGDQMRRASSAMGLYSHALSALERQEIGPSLLEELRHPAPELADFGETLSRIAEQIVLRRKRNDEMASAAIIQRALLPKADEFAQEYGVDVAAAMTPALDVGGDFYDLVPLNDGRVALGVGDVCGKGVPAALFMGISKSLIRINLRENPDLPAAILRANSYIINNNAANLYATALYAAYDPASGVFEFCSCGHNPGFIRRADGRVEKLPFGGRPLGMFDDIRLTVKTERLDPGDLLFLYTDGLTEAEDARLTMFGEPRLMALIAEDGAHAADWVTRAIHEVRHFARGIAPSDDLTCLALRR